MRPISMAAPSSLTAGAAAAVAAVPSPLLRPCGPPAAGSSGSLLRLCPPSRAALLVPALSTHVPDVVGGPAAAGCCCCCARCRGTSRRLNMLRVAAKTPRVRQVLCVKTLAMASMSCSAHAHTCTCMSIERTQQAASDLAPCAHLHCVWQWNTQRLWARKDQKPSKHTGSTKRDERHKVAAAARAASHDNERS